MKLTKRQQMAASCVNFTPLDPREELNNCTCSNYPYGMPVRRGSLFSATKEEIRNGEDCCPFKGIYSFHTCNEKWDEKSQRFVQRGGV